MEDVIDEELKYLEKQNMLPDVTQGNQPIGVMAEELWVLSRCKDLARAIHDSVGYEKTSHIYECEWAEELLEHIKFLREIERVRNDRKEV